MMGVMMKKASEDVGEEGGRFSQLLWRKVSSGSLDGLIRLS